MKFRSQVLPLVFTIAPLLGQTAPVTFYKDVMPVIQRRCQECHRKGEAAPFAMTSYAETRPWAKAIRQAVLTKKMPPWFAKAAPGVFSNDRRMSQAEIEAIRAWADAGAPEGDRVDAPAAVVFAEGWRIGKPDQTFEMAQDFQVPAAGEVPWKYFAVKTGFKEDRWVRAVEARPGNSAVVHHIRVFARPPGSQAFMDSSPLSPMTSQQRQHPSKPPIDDGGVLVGLGEEAIEMTAYVPGGDPVSLAPGAAMRVKAGSELVLEVHYAPNGKAQSDRSRVGLIFSPEPPKTRVAEIALANLQFRIPAGAANYRVDSAATVSEPMTVLSVWPHMHLRGKALVLRALYPSGESETLLDVPRYDFNWQMSYVLSKPRLLPKGTRLESAVYFDNSANNPANPDPTVDVYWGDQTWEEMNTAFLRVALPERPDSPPQEHLVKE